MLAIILCFSSYQVSAQIEVSTNPIAVLFEAIPLTINKPINQDFGVGLDILAVPGAGTVIYYAKGRYYFSPRMGADRFHIGTFLGGVSDSFGIGFFVGQKIMSAKGVFLDLGVGLGRSFGGDVPLLPYGQLHVGYRFGRKTM